MRDEKPAQRDGTGFYLKALEDTRRLYASEPSRSFNADIAQILSDIDKRDRERAVIGGVITARESD